DSASLSPGPSPRSVLRRRATLSPAAFSQSSWQSLLLSESFVIAFAPRHGCQNIGAGNNPDRASFFIYYDQAVHVGVDHHSRQPGDSRVRRNSDRVGGHVITHLLGWQFFQLDDLPIGQDRVRFTANQCFLAIRTDLLQLNGTYASGQSAGGGLAPSWISVFRLKATSL